MWFNCTKTALKKLQVAYNNSLRRFMGLPWRNSASEMFVNLNIRSFDELLRMFVFGFRSRIINSNNLLISSIYKSTCRIYSSMWTWWDNLLYIFNSENAYTYSLTYVLCGFTHACDLFYIVYITV